MAPELPNAAQGGQGPSGWDPVRNRLRPQSSAGGSDVRTSPPPPPSLLIAGPGRQSPSKGRVRSRQTPPASVPPRGASGSPRGEESWEGSWSP